MLVPVPGLSAWVEATASLCWSTLVQKCGCPDVESTVKSTDRGQLLGGCQWLLLKLTLAVSPRSEAPWVLSVGLVALGCHLGAVEPCAPHRWAEPSGLIKVQSPLDYMYPLQSSTERQNAKRVVLQRHRECSSLVPVRIPRLLNSSLAPDLALFDLPAQNKAPELNGAPADSQWLLTPWIGSAVPRGPGLSIARFSPFLTVNHPIAVMHDPKGYRLTGFIFAQSAPSDCHLKLESI